MWFQHTLTLPAKTRGFHLITREVLQAIPEISQVKTGMLNVFIQHTSASLTINENASPDVRRDFERYFNRSVPDSTPYFEHDDEGPDDMPAHIKSSQLGASLNIPIQDGRLALGTWQGIYLGEHRERGGSRRLVITAFGQGK
ncbi:secondary thiamine-phosphate synthase enzyme YjbQ [Deinococcus cellulosilyticus]|uniref:secondary thiamine-phosphate synthase enzyme YjbQ n=1 Tax=Deinococcus cellulosilyticus TaxID=401558 RepID=UPI0011BE75D9